MWAWATPAAPAESAREVAERVRDWRTGHERQVLSELMGLLEIPNVAADREDIQRNAEALVTLLEGRGARAEILENEPGPPAVFGEILTPAAQRTVVFYAHYDGQPADPADWTPRLDPVGNVAILQDGTHEQIFAMAFTDSGTSARVCSRFCAVTVISSSTSICALADVAVRLSASPKIPAPTTRLAGAVLVVAS